MKWLARVVAALSPVLVTVEVVLMLRPGRADNNWGGWDYLRVGALAAGVALCAMAAASAALWRRQWPLAVAAGILAATVPLGVLRYPTVPRLGMVLVVTAWFASAAPALAVVLGSSVVRGLPTPLMVRAAIAATALSAVAVAIADRGRGLGSYLAGPPNGQIDPSARSALWVHLAVTVVALVLVGRQVRSVAGARRDPVVWAAALWVPMVIGERVVHLGWSGRYDQGIVGRYSSTAMALGVNLPLLASLVLVVVATWATSVRPRLARLPEGTIVVADRDPFEVIRADLAAWLGDPSLTVEVTDAGGPAPVEIGPEVGATRRAATTVKVAGRTVAVLHHDVGLAGAHHELHTTAVLAGLAEDANRLLAEELASLHHAQQLARRLVRADAEVRDRLGEELGQGPIAQLWRCADALAFGASLEEVSDQLRAITAEVRHLSHGVYPPELLTGPLRSALPGHAGAPERILAAPIQVTAYLLARHDPQATFELHDACLLVRLPSGPPPLQLLDRVEGLGGTVGAGVVELPLLLGPPTCGIEPAPTEEMV